MRLSVLVVSLSLFWVMAACGLRPDPISTGGDSAAGAQDLYRVGCGSCHTIPGVTGAHGEVGPSLEGIAGRSYIAGQLSNQPSNLERWIQHPHSVHPDSLMPELGVSDAQARDIASYLYSLKQTH
jgi:cytochrome c